MYKFYLKNQKLIKNLPLCLLIYGIALFLAISDVRVLSGEAVNSADIVVRYFSSIKAPDAQEFLFPILLLGMNLLCLYVFTGEFREELRIAYPYIFTRYGSRKIWLLRRLLELSKKVLLYMGFQLVVVLAAAAIFSDYTKLSSQMLGQIFIILLLYYLYVLLLTSFSNMLAVKLGDNLGVFITLALTALNLLLAAFIYSNNYSPVWMYLLPVTNIMYFWHQDSVLGIFANGVGQMSGFYLWGSVLTLVLLIAFIYVIFAFVLEKQDSIALIGEE